MGMVIVVGFVMILVIGCQGDESDNCEGGEERDKESRLSFISL